MSTVTTDDDSRIQKSPSAPRISYVIPCYNARRYLEACLRSIVTNETEPFEIFVVDDGSTDEICDVVESFTPAVHYIRQENQGAGAARNTGIRAANGQYIRFVDADDILLSPEALREQIAVLDRNLEVGLVYGQSIVTDDDGRPIGRRRPRFARSSYVRDGAEELERLLLTNYITTSTTVVRRNLLTQVGLFRPDLRAGQDYDYWLRIARLADIAYVAMPVAAYRKHETGITAMKTQEQRRQKMAVIDQLFEDEHFASRYGRIRKQIEARRAWKIISLAYRTGQYQTARSGAMRGILQSIRRRDWELLQDYALLMVRIMIPTRLRNSIRNITRRRRDDIAADFLTDNR